MDVGAHLATFKRHQLRRIIELDWASDIVVEAAEAAMIPTGRQVLRRRIGMRLIRLTGQ